MFFFKICPVIIVFSFLLMVLMLLSFILKIVMRGFTPTELKHCFFLYNPMPNKLKFICFFKKVFCFVYFIIFVL